MGKEKSSYNGRQMKKLLLIFLFPIILQAQLLTLLFSDDDLLNFTDIPLAYSYTEYVSDSIVWTGGAKNVSVTDCYYRIGLDGTITNTSGSITFGDTLWLVDTTSATGSIYGGTLTIGGVSDSWTINCPLQAILFNGIDEYAHYQDSVQAITWSATDTLIIQFDAKPELVGSNGDRYIIVSGWLYISMYELNGNYGVKVTPQASGLSGNWSRTNYDIPPSVWYSIEVRIHPDMVYPEIYVDGINDVSAGSSTDTIASSATAYKLGIGNHWNPPSYGSTRWFKGELGTVIFKRNSVEIGRYDWSGSSTDWLKFKNSAYNYDLTGVGVAQ